VTVDPPSQSVAVTHTVKFTTIVSGIGKENFSYQWRHNGKDINGNTRGSLIINNVKEDHSGIYECVIFNAYGDNKKSNASKLIVKSKKLTWNSEKFSYSNIVCMLNFNKLARVMLHNKTSSPMFCALDVLLNVSLHDFISFKIFHNVQSSLPFSTTACVVIVKH